MGELILNEKYLTITFRYRERREDPKAKGYIAWDCNEKSLDGFSPKLGWVKIDLTGLFHIHRVYELKRRRLQKKASKKTSLKRILTKHSEREKNRTRDFAHKLTTFLAEEFKGYVHGFERLKKERMLKRSRKHNRNVSKSNWKTIQSLIAYKSTIVILNPKNTSKGCSRCGMIMINSTKGAICEC